MNIKSVAGSLGIAVACAGCASGIQVARLTPGQTATGVPWNLAMTQYTVTITRQLRHCGNSLSGTVTVSAVTGKKIDDDQRYVLFSNGVRATADITSTLATDGTSTGLNAHSEDQTATIISNTVGVLAAVATAGAAAGGPLHFACSADVDKALGELYPVAGRPLKDVVDQETRDVALATAKVTQLTTLYQAESGQKAEIAAPAPAAPSAAAHGARPKKGLPPPDPSTSLRVAVADLLKKQDKLNTDQATLNAALKVVTATQTVIWPASAATTTTASSFTLDQGVASSWVEWNDKQIHRVPTKDFDVHLALYQSDGAGGWRLPAAAPSTGDVAVGVPVRVPRPGRLLACTLGPCKPSLAADWVPDDTQTLPLGRV
ncbi:hypothetical protein ACL58G_29440 [Massilia sp. GER05]|uniref:hypothetical protein n=1 Tax=Massilia sp. GER05 TaxID=3394605 RepID=UPI003F85E59D